MPLFAVSTEPVPSASSTRTGMIFAPGAVPATPMPLLVSAAMIPATCVPCPFSSRGPLHEPPPFTRSIPLTKRPLRSGCERSTPESTTATLTAPPFAPRAHAAGALI